MMKKTSEMNGIERIAYRNIKRMFNYEVGGWYNCILDHCPEYIPDSIEEAKKIVYESSMNDWWNGGMHVSGGAPKEMRFAGSEFVRECIDFLFDTDGDVEEIAEAKNWEVML